MSQVFDYIELDDTTMCYCCLPFAYTCMYATCKDTVGQFNVMSPNRVQIEHSHILLSSHEDFSGSTLNFYMPFFCGTHFN